MPEMMNGMLGGGMMWGIGLFWLLILIPTRECRCAWHAGYPAK